MVVGLAMDVMKVRHLGWTEMGIAKNPYRTKHLDPLLGFKRSAEIPTAHRAMDSSIQTGLF